MKKNISGSPYCHIKVIGAYARPAVSNSHCSEGQMRTHEVPRAAFKTLTQQWRCLNLTRNSFLRLISSEMYHEL